VPSPNAAYGRCAQTNSRANVRVLQCVASRGFLGGQTNDLLDAAGRNFRLSTWPRSILLDAGDTEAMNRPRQRATVCAQSQLVGNLLVLLRRSPSESSSLG